MYAKAVNNYYASCNNRVIITDKMRLMWSPLNGYSIDIIQNDNCNKYWICQRGHTFLRRYDVFKRGYTDCPYCTGRQSFRFLLLRVCDSIFTVLDISNGDIEEVSSDELLGYLNSGINIKGVFFSNGVISMDISYLYSYKLTTFRTYFLGFKDKGFNCVTKSISCKNLVNRLNRLFMSDTYIDKIYPKFIELIRGYEMNLIRN